MIRKYKDEISILVQKIEVGLDAQTGLRRRRQHSGIGHHEQLTANPKITILRQQVSACHQRDPLDNRRLVVAGNVQHPPGHVAPHQRKLVLHAGQLDSELL